MKTIGRTFVIPVILLIQLGLVSQAAAQSASDRSSLTAEARLIAPQECAGVSAPSPDLTLDEQLKKWRELEDCVASAGTNKRIAAFRGDASAQAAAALQAADEQRFRAKFAAARQETENQKNFLGWSWGVGFGFGWADDDRVDQAQIVNNVVRVTKESSEQARLFLEYHWFPESWQKTLGKKENDSIVRAQGPFVAVSSRDDKVLSGVGIGWMIGFREKSKSEGFGIAIGAILDNDVTDLADGFEDGQPPPNGETTIRTESKSRVSYVLFFTRSF